MALLSDQKDNLQKEVESLRVSVQNASQALGEEIAKHDAYLNTAKEAKTELDQVKLELENLRQTRKQVQGDVDSLRSTNGTLSAQKEQLTAQNSELEKTIEKLKQEQTTLQKEIASRQLTLSETDTALKAVQDAKNQAAQLRTVLCKRKLVPLLKKK